MTDLIRPLNIRQNWIKLQWVPGIYVRVVDVRWPGDTASPRVMPAFPHESARWYACIDQWSVEPIAKVYYYREYYGIPPRDERVGSNTTQQVAMIPLPQALGLSPLSDPSSALGQARNESTFASVRV